MTIAPISIGMRALSSHSHYGTKLAAKLHCFLPIQNVINSTTRAMTCAVEDSVTDRQLRFYIYYITVTFSYTQYDSTFSDKFCEHYI